VVRSLRNYNGVPADTFVSQILGVLGNSRWTSILNVWLPVQLNRGLRAKF